MKENNVSKRNQATTQEECTEQLMECHSECDINDKECKEECVEDYKGCETMVHVDEGEIISELLTLTALLDGNMSRLETSNSIGRTSKKIVIEYDIKERDQRSS
tara:strand:+ start:2764 stop:3075 length:312 start_codon:yes stop_codon:yes gene_type:complete